MRNTTNVNDKKNLQKQTPFFSQLTYTQIPFLNRCHNGDKKNKNIRYIQMKLQTQSKFFGSFIKNPK